MISAVRICRVIISFTWRSIDLWHSMYFSVSGLWEAEVALSISPGGETHLLCLPQPYKVPLQFFAFPANGDSTCPPRCRAFLREIPDFISKLSWVSRSVSVSQLCPGALFYLGFFALFLGSFGLVFWIQCPWSDPGMMCADCVSLKGSPAALWARGYFPLQPSPGNIVLMLLSNQKSWRRGQECGLVQLDKVQDVSLRLDF